MSKIAVDAVFLPSEEMNDTVIRESKRLRSSFDSAIVLNQENCLPHLSLGMGCLKDEDVSAIEKILDTVAHNVSRLNLKAVGAYGTKDKEGFCGIEVEKTQELQRIHEEVMNELSRFFTYDAAREMFYLSENFDARTLAWADSFPEHSFSNFFPHITTGFGTGCDRNTKLNFPINFTASQLALCQLGSHCTCRKILWSMKL